MLLECLLGFTQCLEILKTSGSVTVLDSSNWANLVENRDRDTVWMVMFYGDHCPSCVAVAPDFVRAAEKGSKYANFASVDTTAEQEIAQNLHIGHIPAFIIFHSQGTTDYDGSRTPESFIEAIGPYFKACLQEFSESWLSDGKFSAILFTYGDSIPFGWKVFSCQKKSIRVGHSKDGPMRQSLGAPLAPAAFLINKTHRTYFKDPQDAVKNSDLFFAGRYIRPPPVVSFLLPFEFAKECKSPTKFCAISISNQPSEHLKAAAREYSGFGVKFFQGEADEEWPLKGVRDGQNWIVLVEDEEKYVYKLGNKELLKDVIGKCLQNDRAVKWTKM
jgi:thiol-disulfide isomerase/thioredoxin